MTRVANMSKQVRSGTVDVHGFALREIRQLRGQKVADLSALLSCDRSYITKIETGHSRRVSREFYSNLVAALGEPRLDYRALLVNPFGGEDQERVA